MFKIKLNQEEEKVLLETLQSYLSDLRYEIADTDSFDYRERLKLRKAVLEKIVKDLDEQVANH
jgi:hypothetical protein